MIDLYIFILRNAVAQRAVWRKDATKFQRNCQMLDSIVCFADLSSNGSVISALLRTLLRTLFPLLLPVFARPYHVGQIVSERLADIFVKSRLIKLPAVEKSAAFLPYES